MSLTITPVHPLFAAEIGGVDLSGTLDAATQSSIERAIETYGVVVFRDQSLTNNQQLAFAERFGPIEASVTSYRKDNKVRLDKPGLVDVSNLDENNAPRKADDRLRLMFLGNQLWHTDSSFRAIPGALSMLYAHVVPPRGGDTEFCDMRAAYDALDDDMKAQLEDLEIEHSLMHSRALLGYTDFSAEERAALPPVRHAAVRGLPWSGRKALYLGSHAGEAVGMPLSDGKMLLRELMEHATQRQFVHAHHWRVGDLVIWDNRCTLHRGRPYDEAHPRDLRRVTTSDVPVTTGQYRAAG